MQMHKLETLYHQFQSALRAFPDASNSLCLYESTNGEYFMYPQPSFVLSTSSSLANVLPDLKTRFCVQATGTIFQTAIDSAIMMLHHEVEFACGFSVRVVDNPAQLPSVASYYQSAFVRDDRCLVVWGDSVDNVMASWNDICLLLQSQFGCVPLHSNPMVGFSYGDTLGTDQFNLTSAPPAEGSTHQPNDFLSYLNDLSYLETVPGPTTPSPSLDSASYGAYPLTDSAWLLGQSESPAMSVLELGLQTLNTSDSLQATDVPSHGFGNMPLTLSLASISPPPVGFDIFQDDDPVTTTTSSLGFSTSASDGAVSPASFFSQSPGAQQNSFAFSTDAAGPLSFRRHSFGVSSDSPAPRTVGMKTRRGGDDNAYNFTAVDDVSHFLTAGTHTSKRRRAAADEEPIVKATSAPALFTVPLPNVEHAQEQNECDDDDGSSSVSGQSFALTTPLSATSSLFPSPSPAPTSTSTSTSPPAPASRRVRRRAGTSGGGRRAPRTPCRYCPKSFTRAQDAQRHESRSCPQNPNKEGVWCPECGEVLSRTDSVQRHWRGHKDPQCEPPAWANVRA